MDRANISKINAKISMPKNSCGLPAFPLDSATKAINGVTRDINAVGFILSID